MPEAIRWLLALGGHWSYLERDAQTPTRQSELVGLVDIRIHTAPLQCVVHTGVTP